MVQRAQIRYEILMKEGFCFKKTPNEHLFETIGKSRGRLLF